MRDAERKAREARSRRTKKHVGESAESFTIEGQLGPGIGLAFNYTGPPQLDQDRAFELARMHLTAFLSMQTYNREEMRGRYWLGDFLPMLTSGGETGAIRSCGVSWTPSRPGM